MSVFGTISSPIERMGVSTNVPASLYDPNAQHRSVSQLTHTQSPSQQSRGSHLAGNSPLESADYDETFDSAGETVLPDVAGQLPVTGQKRLRNASDDSVHYRPPAPVWTVRLPDAPADDELVPATPLDD
jgi:hypothetical protein